MHCHACSGNFVAELDMEIDGQHVVECPSCGHLHYRIIKGGKITEARWDSDNSLPQVKVDKRSVWKSSVIAAQTSTVSAFIRDRWLNRSDFNGR